MFLRTLYICCVIHFSDNVWSLQYFYLKNRASCVLDLLLQLWKIKLAINSHCLVFLFTVVSSKSILFHCNLTISRSQLSEHFRNFLYTPSLQYNVVFSVPVRKLSSWNLCSLNQLENILTSWKFHKIFLIMYTNFFCLHRNNLSSIPCC